MSQSRTCKLKPTVTNGNNASRNRPSKARAADDSHSRVAHLTNGSRRSRSKDKIPKSLRYDLENTLVGLCDTWFEDIKPHLIRNNIKIHVRNASVNAASACASGDHEQPTTGAPQCSHLDPGAAPDVPRRTGACYADCSVMQPTASKVRCVKPQACSQCQRLQPAPSPSNLELSQNCPQKLHRNCEKTLGPGPSNAAAACFRRKSLISQSPTRTSGRVPRMCCTFSVIPSTITHPASMVPLCPSSSPQRAVCLKSANHLVSVASQTCSSVASLHASLPPRLCPLSRHRNTASISHRACQDPHNTKDSVLFQNDLIDIIGRCNDKILKRICKNPDTVRYPSLMNLVSPKNRRKSNSKNKIPPWR